MHGLDNDRLHGRRGDPLETRSAGLVITMRSLHHLSIGLGNFLTPVLSPIAAATPWCDLCVLEEFS